MPTAVEYLKDLMSMADKSPALLNFLNTHKMTGTLRGSPLWSRSPEYYSRGRKTYPSKGGNIPGGARREMRR